MLTFIDFVIVILSSSLTAIYTNQECYTMRKETNNSRLPPIQLAGLVSEGSKCMVCSLSFPPLLLFELSVVRRVLRGIYTLYRRRRTLN